MASPRRTVSTRHSRPPSQNADSNPRPIRSTAPMPTGIPPPTIPTSEHLVGPCAPNIVVFGEIGVGKSSIINLIAGQKLAPTSADALGCTTRCQQYTATLDESSCTLWDTVGLDEGDEGTNSSGRAESDPKALMQQLVHSGGVHLVMYCIRASRLTNSMKRNYDLFYAAVRSQKVPIALIVTGLEHEQGGMEAWWATNEAELRHYGIRFDTRACVTTLDVEDDVVQQQRSDSQTFTRARG